MHWLRAQSSAHLAVVNSGKYRAIVPGIPGDRNCNRIIQRLTIRTGKKNIGNLWFVAYPQVLDIFPAVQIGYGLFMICPVHSAVCINCPDHLIAPNLVVMVQAFGFFLIWYVFRQHPRFLGYHLEQIQSGFQIFSNLSLCADTAGSRRHTAIPVKSYARPQDKTENHSNAANPSYFCSHLSFPFI